MDYAGPPGWARALGWAGIGGHLALLFLYSISGLIAPVWGVGLLWVVWAALLVGAVWLRRRRPALVPLVPVAGVLLWLAVIWAGGAWLGWTA